MLRGNYTWSLLIDRTTSRVTLMASTEGGMDVEEVARRHPGKNFRGHRGSRHWSAAIQLPGPWRSAWLKGPQVRAAGKLMMAVYNAFVACDASLIEINPLAVTADAGLSPWTPR